MKDFPLYLSGVAALADPGALDDAARVAEDLRYHFVLARRGFPYDPDRAWLAGRVRQRLEQIATGVIAPYRRGA